MQNHHNDKDEEVFGGKDTFVVAAAEYIRWKTILCNLK